MSMFRTMFATARVPGEVSDSFSSYSTGIPMHIVVMSRSKAYRMQVLQPSSDGSERLLKVDQVQEALHSIVEHADEQAAHVTSANDLNVSLLTTERRDRWALSRLKVSNAHADNATHLADIENALFVLCLDQRPAAMKGVSGGKSSASVSSVESLLFGGRIQAKTGQMSV